MVEWPLGTDPRRHAGGFLGGRDTYFCRKETRAEGGNSYLRPGDRCLRRTNNRFQSGDNCVVSINNDVRPGDDRVRSGPPGCALGPPDGQLVAVATVSLFDSQSGLASFDVTATSNEPSDPATIVITRAPGSGSGFERRTVQLRLQRDRIYTIAATATDSAGNSVAATTTCTVPHKHWRRHRPSRVIRR